MHILISHTRVCGRLGRGSSVPTRLRPGCRSRLDIPRLQAVKWDVRWGEVLHILCHELCDSHGLVAAWAASADADGAHPSVARVASLVAESPFAALVAFVDRHRPPVSFGRCWRYDRRDVVSASPCGHAARVGAVAASTRRGKGLAAHRAVDGHRYVIVTRRGSGRCCRGRHAATWVSRRRWPQALSSS